MALIYSISENHLATTIDGKAVAWARDLIFWQTRRMLFMAQSHVCDNPFEANCQKFLSALRKEKSKKMPRSNALRKMKMQARDFTNLTETLFLRREITIDDIKSDRHTTTYYKINTGTI